MLAQTGWVDYLVLAHSEQWLVEECYYDNWSLMTGVYWLGKSHKVLVSLKQICIL